MKKLLSALLVILLVFSLCGCITIEIRSSKTSEDQSSASGAESQTSAAESRAESSEPVAESSVPEETSPDEPTDESSGEPVETDGISPLLWRVSDGSGHSIYLFGTIHIGDERTYAAIGQVEKYIDECDAVAVEFDVIAYSNDMEANIRDLQQFFYTDGTTIRDHISPELVDRVITLLNGVGAYTPVYERMNAAMWSQLVSDVLLMTKTDLASDYGADMNILDKCHTEGKEILELESASLQYGVINAFGDSFYEYMINSSLDSAEFYGEACEAMYTAWLEGDADTLLEFVGDGAAGGYEEGVPAEEIDEYNYKMGTERNLGMFKKARAWLDSGKKVFVTAGEAHMLAADGLVSLFEDAGYKVEKIATEVKN